MRCASTKVLLFLILFSSSSHGQLVGELRILYVFSDEAASSVVDAVNQFNSMKSLATNIFEDSGIVDTPTFLLYTPLYDFQYEPGWTYLGVSSEMSTDSVIKSYRDANAIDLIVVVMETYNNIVTSAQGCGTAPAVADEFPDILDILLNPIPIISASDKHVAVVTTNKPGCATKTPEQISSHEIGHLLFAEHELEFDANGQPLAAPSTPDTGYDTKPNVPVPYNHATELAGFTTIVGTSPTSARTNIFSGSGNNLDLPSGTASTVGPWTDIKKLINDDTYQIVSLYRPKPAQPPQVADCQIVFTPICGDPYSNQVSVTLGGFTITNMDIDFQVGTSGTGPWNDLYEGSGQTCPGFMSPLINTIRALLTTTQGLSQCDAVVFPVYQSPDCDSPGGGIFN